MTVVRRPPTGPGGAGGGHRIDTFGIDDLEVCRQAVARIGEAAGSMEEAARGIVRHLHEVVVTPGGDRALALVRFYKTHRLRDLDAGLQAAAAAAAGRRLAATTRCLTLLATAGVEPAWNDRRTSVDHRAIPLVSEAAVARSPMVADLIRQLGVDLAWVVDPDEDENLSRHHRDYGVFYVPEARGSDLVPAQQGFVEPYGIRSVVGFGGVLPSGDLFAVVAFSTWPVPEEVADLFRSLAFSVKAAVVPFTFDVFDG